MQLSPTARVSDQTLSPDVQLRKRKIRKGTTSCWQCKHRKIRCHFATQTSLKCNSCQRHGWSCVSQEFDEGVEDEYHRVEKGIHRIENLIDQLVQHKGVQKAGKSPNRPTAGQVRSPGNKELERRLARTPDSQRRLLVEAAKASMPSPWSLLTSVGQDLMSRCSSLNTYLESVLPDSNTASLILLYGKSPFEILNRPKRAAQAMEAWNLSFPRIPKQPLVAARSLLLARRLVQLALCLQQLENLTSKKPKLGLDEPGLQAACRYVDVARHVTSQDSLVTSIEGVETLLLEACFLGSMGNLHGAWLTARRALGIAQLMDIAHTTNDGGRCQFLWFRLLFFDRFASLMLGVPSGNYEDPKVENPSQEDICLQFDRLHVTASGRIIARNGRLKNRTRGDETLDAEFDLKEYKETQSIDSLMQQMAWSLPTGWWALPDEDGVATKDVVTKMIAQMHQHYLIVLLHLPYLLESLTTPLNEHNESPSKQKKDYTYNKLAICSASREVISRCAAFFKMFRTRSSYPGIDHKTFIAVAALLLAHIDGHRLGSINLLGHQRPQDLRLLQRLVEIFERIVSVNPDGQTAKDMVLTRQLCEIEAESAAGTNFIVWTEDKANGAVDRPANSQTRLSFSLPYAGTINIANQEDLSTENRSSVSPIPSITVSPPMAQDDIVDISNNQEIEQNVLGQDTAAFDFPEAQVSWQTPYFTNSTENVETSVTMHQSVNFQIVDNTTPHPVISYPHGIESSAGSAQDLNGSYPLGEVNDALLQAWTYDEPWLNQASLGAES